MPRRHQRDLDAAARDRLAIARGLAAAGKILAAACRHDRQGLWGRQHGAVAGTSMVGMAMSDHGMVHRLGWIDVKVSWRAIEPLGCVAQKQSEPGHRAGTCQPAPWLRQGGFSKPLI